MLTSPRQESSVGKEKEEGEAMDLVGCILFPFVGVLALAVTAFWIWMVVDCATKEPSGSDKIVWILVIIFLHWLGGIIYLFAEKLPRDRESRLSQPPAAGGGT